MTENIIALIDEIRAARGEDYADGYVDALNVLVSASRADETSEDTH